MGVYDTIKVPCPKCGEIYYAQSKSGPCELDLFDLDKAPYDVLCDVNRHAPFTCFGCNCVFDVDLNFLKGSFTPEEIKP